MPTNTEARVEAITPLLAGVPAGTAQDKDLAAQATRAFVSTGSSTTPVSLVTLEALADRVRAGEELAAGGAIMPLPEEAPALPEEPEPDPAPGPADDDFPPHTCPYRSEINDDDSLCTCSPNRTRACALEI